MYIKNVRYESNLYNFIFSAMLSWITHLKPDSELPKELLSIDALLNIVDFSIKVLDENVNLTRNKKYFSKEAWNHLNDITKKKTRFVTCVCQTYLHSEDCVACDVCLNWYHLRCIGLRFAPEKTYWCC
jgi:hypothetical protein